MGRGLCHSGQCISLVGHRRCPYSLGCRFACPAGSTNDTVIPCGPGQYSDPGAGVCTLCPYVSCASSHCNVAGACSGVDGVGPQAVGGQLGAHFRFSVSCCVVPPALSSGGRYGDGFALNSSACTDLCFAGYACPPGTVVPSRFVTAQWLASFNTSGSRCFPRS
jgi:hypothetical protein